MQGEVRKSAMVTLQDFSLQSRKQLGDWSFPLSELLEMYVKELTSINFDEAALVLQNAANVYVHRVHRLYNETTMLQQSFIESEESVHNTSKVSRDAKHTAGLNSLDDFHLIDMGKDVSQNITLRTESEKSVKLISRRFTQLENTSDTHSDLLIYDTNGESIGKKYKFRCTQFVDINGVLVDEHSPDDYQCTLNCCVRERRNPSLTSSENHTVGTGTSGYQSGTSPYETNVIGNDYSQDFDTDTASSRHAENTDAEKMMDITASEGLSDLCTTGDTSIECNSPVSDKNQNVLNVADASKTETEKCLNSRKKVTDKTASKPMVLKSTIMGDFDKNISTRLDTNQDPTKPQNPRNEQDKGSINIASDINEDEWRVMPLPAGTKNGSTKNSPLLLPRHIIALLKPPLRRKRKTPIRHKKIECLAEYVLKELKYYHVQGTYNNTRGKFKILRKEELENFQKNFDECFNVAQNVEKFEASTNEEMNLLGFRCTTISTDSSNDYMCNSSRSPSPIEMNSRSSGPSSPCGDWGQPDPSYTLPNYQTLIEDKMKEVFKECDTSTELQQAVANWHRSMQPKLLEAERRAEFPRHEYAARIIQRVCALDKQKCNFHDVVRGQPVCEIARYFFVSLDLASKRKVEINSRNNNEIEIELLTEKKD